MAKDKKEKKEKGEEVEKAAPAEKESLPYEVLASRVTKISQPLAGKALTKQIYKMVKKAAKSKQLCRGVKEVGKALRKGTKGVCVIAGDISPIDVITHMPVLCEDHKVPYCFVPSKEDLGAAGQTKRPTSVVLVKKSAEVDNFDEVSTEMSALPVTW